MASSRDDFIIAIRSAFLKKSTKQKFSLLTLVLLSIFIIFLSSLKFKPINNLRSIINEIVYRSSFIVSVPENLIKNSYIEIIDHLNLYKNYEKNKIELEELKSKNITNEIVKSENRELKNLIEDYTITTNKILAKVIVDHDSPFLKTIIINKGSSENIKIGTNIYDKSYLVGRVIEVNYKSSRVLLLSDLNSSVPVSISPGNIQAIIVGTGNDKGEIKYVKGNFINEIKDKSIAYTSGAGSIFKSGTPIGKIDFNDNNDHKQLLVNFYSDFTQLKYVFVEVLAENKLTKNNSGSSSTNFSQSPNTETIKLNLLNEEVEIYKDSNEKFIQENEKLKIENSQFKDQIENIQNELDNQKEKINQNEIDLEELKFLRLNLIYSHKCQKTLFKQGYKVGSQKYKNCILRKGKFLND